MAWCRCNDSVRVFYSISEDAVEEPNQIFRAIERLSKINIDKKRIREFEEIAME